MTTAIIGTGGPGSVIARQLAAGGEALRLSSADTKSAQTLAAGIGGTVVVATDNHDALQGASAVILALRFTVLKCPKGSPLAKSWPDGCWRERTWPWRSGAWQATSSRPPATGRRSERRSST